MSNITLGLIIGASLASSFNDSVGSAVNSLSQIQQKSERLKLKKQIGQQYIDLQNEIEKTGVKFEATGYKSVALGRRMVALAKASQSAGTSARGLGYNLDTIGTEMIKVTRESRRAEKAITRIQAVAARKAELGNLRMQLIGVMGAGYAIGRALKPVIEFEESFADVRKVVDDSDENLNLLKDDLLHLSTVIPMTGTELTRITAAAGQSNIVGRKALIDFTTTASKMGIAFDISAEEAGRAMAEIKNNCHLSQPEVEKLGDAMNYLTNKTAANAPDLVEYMRRVGSIGKIAGLSGEKVAALGTAFIATGSAPEVAARASNALIMKLSNVSGESDKVQEAFSRLGYNPRQLERRMLKNPQQTIMDFLERVSKSKNKLAVLSETIGSGFADDIAKLITGLDDYKRALNLVSKESDYAGSMEKEFEARSKTTANALQLLKNQSAVAANNLGEVFLPQIVAGAQFLGIYIGKFAAWAQQNPETVKIIGNIIAGFYGMKAAMIVGRMAILGIANAFSVVMAHPIVFGLVAIGLVAYQIWKNWDFLRGKLLQFWDGIKTTWASIGEALKGFFSPFFTWLSEKVDWIVGKWSAFKSLLSIGPDVGNVPTGKGSNKGAPQLSLSGHALGGVFDKPHIAAISEGGKKEAIIPLEGNKEHARSIHTYVGMMLGRDKEDGPPPRPTATIGKTVIVQKNDRADAPVANNTINKSQIENNARATHLFMGPFYFNITPPAGSNAADVEREVRKILAGLERRARSRERGKFIDAPIFG